MSSANDEEEAIVVRMLENLNVSTLTMQGLQKAYQECQGSSIGRVFLADILFRITKCDLEEFCCEVENLMELLVMRSNAEADEEANEEDKAESADQEAEDTFEDVYVTSVVDWIGAPLESVPSIAPPTLTCLLPIAYASAHSLANPCHLEMEMGSAAILPWRDFQEAASTFSSISHPHIVDALPVIRSLRRRPFLDCRGLSADEGAQLAKFDKTWERFCSLYPIVNVLADPALVLVEPVIAGALPPQVASVITAINTAVSNPLPSGGAPPVQVADVMGNFTHLFQLASMDDARTFAAMLRGQLADATGGGGAGPAVRIVAFNAAPASFRVY